jgi:hypothetical protein
MIAESLTSDPGIREQNRHEAAEQAPEARRPLLNGDLADANAASALRASILRTSLDRGRSKLVKGFMDQLFEDLMTGIGRAICGDLRGRSVCDR